MRLYSHYQNSVHPVTIDENHTISQLADRLCQTLGCSQVKISKFKSGSEISTEISVKTFFEDFDDVWVIKAEEKKELPKHLPPPAALQFVSLSKYSYYEYDNLWVRVEVPFAGIGKHDKKKVTCNFDTTSFVLSILDFEAKNYHFSVMRLQCSIQPELCKFAVLADKVRISLRKVKENDNWFSLFKTKTIGGDD